MANLIMPLLWFFINSALGVFVWQKNKRSDIHILFAVFAVSTGSWVLTTELAAITGNILFGRLSFVSCILIMSALFFFVYLFGRSQRIKTWQLILFLGLPVIFLVLAFTDLMVADMQVRNGHLTGVFGPAFYPYCLFIVAYSLSTLSLLYHKYRTSTGLARLRIKYMFLGITLFIIPGLLTNSILPALLDYRGLNTLGPYFSVFMVGFTSYAIARYKLMDIRIVIQTSLVYSLLFCLVVFFYLSLLFLAAYFFQKTSATATVLVAGLAAGIAALTVRHLERFFRRKTDPFFNKHKPNYSEAIHHISRVLNEHIELKQLNSRLINVLQWIFKAESAYIIYLSGKSSFYYDNEACQEACSLPESLLQYFTKQKRTVVTRLELFKLAARADSSKKPIKTLGELCDRKNIQIVVFIWQKGRLVGALGLGEKASQEPYTQDDFQILETLSMQAGVALEKARLYETLKHHSDELENKVAERTADIMRVQKEQEQMFLDISHGLQTPLTVIKNELTRLACQAADASQYNTLNKSTEKISKMVYELLHLSRLESGQYDHPRNRINLSDLMEELIEYLSLVAKEKNIGITNNISPNIIATGNRELVEEMLTNILSNAFKHAFPKNQKEKIINIELYQDFGSPVINIRDNGRGIKQTDIPYLFQRYKRGSYQPGTGLGLTICQRIARIHDGKITVASVFGQGTCFTLTLNQARENRQDK